VGDAIATGAMMAVSAKNANASFIEILSRVECSCSRITREHRLW
jgi:hypothetical protein